MTHYFSTKPPVDKGTLICETHRNEGKVSRCSNVSVPGTATHGLQHLIALVLPTQILYAFLVSLWHVTHRSRLILFELVTVTVRSEEYTL